jgi:hypothetical protein
VPCGQRHNADDPELGAAIDPATYDYEGAVLWNWHAPALLNRFMVELVRVVVVRAGLSEREWRQRVRVAYAKVAEFQLHTRVLADAEEGRELNPGQVAAYVAKYSSKASHEQITTRHTNPDHWRDRDVPEQLVQIAAAALRLMKRSGLQDLGRWMHMLGFRGHFVTKSRGYSATFGEPRATRAAYRARQDEPSDDAEVNDDDSTVVLSVWQYLGSGYLNPGDVLLAAGVEHPYGPRARRCSICVADHVDERPSPTA